MEMDQELKQRLIGALVITALAAIFVPMLFDDAVDETGKNINQLTIPEVPAKAQEVEIMPLPEKAEDIATVIPVEKPNAKRQVIAVDEGEGPSFSEKPQPPAQTVNPGAKTVIRENTRKPIQTFEGNTDMPDEDLIAEDKLPLKSAAKSNTANTLNAKPAPVQANIPPIHKETVAPVSPKPAIIPPAAVATAPAAVAPKTVAPAIPTISATPTAPTAPTASVLPASEGSTRWYLNAGSFTQKANATALQETLKQQGFAATIKESAGEKGLVYKVRIGPIQDKAKAQAVKNKLLQINVNTFFAADE